MRSLEWDIKGFDRDTAVSLCRDHVNPLQAVFLSSRGVRSIDDARTILGITPSDVFDPFLMTDMDKAVSRIRAAINDGERIAIYGDYDVDGMTSCTLLALWLRTQGADYEIYIPGRFGEGYGLNNSALDALKTNGVGLVITVDCGITAIEESLYARSLGLGLVITDHHECRAELPVADAVVNPKRLDCGYPHKALAGVGVAFKLVCALEGDTGSDEIFRQYGDLVAIGTVADVMQVDGENRELIRRGLALINDNPRPGLFSLLRETYPERGKVTTATISYTLAPRLNAAGRMGKPDLTVELLLTDDFGEADRLAAELCLLNNERRSLELKMYEEALAMLPETGSVGPIILANREWSQGVTGIVAAKLAERYHIPAIILRIDENGVCRGSCRSFGTFGIYDALQSCEPILENYGGHDKAAGVTIMEGNLDELQRRITDFYRENYKTVPKPGLMLDFEVEKPEILTIKNVEALESLEPFGNGFPPPCLCIRGANVISAYPIGGGQHMRFRINKSDKILDCIFFSISAEELGISAGMVVDLAFIPQINEFRGRINVQLHLFDIRPAS